VAHSLASFSTYFKKILVGSLHYSLRIFVSSDEKSDCAIAPSDLRGDALGHYRTYDAAVLRDGKSFFNKK